MPQSLSKLYIHTVFHIKSTSVTIRNEDRGALYEYMGGILNHIGCLPIRINGVDDHVHLLCLLSRTVSTAKMMEEVKQRSSCWIKTIDPRYYRYFAWQNGYGAFSVSPSLVKRVEKYIDNQEEHHRTTTFRDEYVAILKDHDVPFNEDYLWTD